jgi:hypothetical protein
VAQKTKNYETNPNLFKPVWKKSFWQVKNEPIVGVPGGEIEAV